MKSIVSIAKCLVPAIFALSLGCVSTAEPEREANPALGSASENGNAELDKSGSNNGYGYEFLPQSIAANAPPTPPSSGTHFADGRIAPEEIITRVRAILPEIRSCYAEALKQEPSLSGQIVVHFVVDPDGTVIESRVNRSTIGNATMSNCVAGAFTSLELPDSPRGKATVYYPIDFTPEALSGAQGS